MSEQQEERFVGIDVSKAMLEVAIRPSGERWSVANEEAGVRELVKALEDRSTLIAVEATAGCSPGRGGAGRSWLACRGSQSRQARNFASDGRLAKTDDRRGVLANFGQAIRPECGNSRTS
jgi:transposase